MKSVAYVSLDVGWPHYDPGQRNEGNKRGQDEGQTNQALISLAKS